MNIAASQNAWPMTFYNSYFSLKLYPKPTRIEIMMKVFNSHIRTGTLPETLPLVKKILPTALESKCFNEENLAFAEEIKNTEIGHLFEHIFLEYLCLRKINRGHRSATFTGRTYWNWEKYERGTFLIKVGAREADYDFVSTALEQTIFLTSAVLRSANKAMQLGLLTDQTSFSQSARLPL